MSSPNSVSTICLNETDNKIIQDKAFGPLASWILGSFLPTNLEMILINYHSQIEKCLIGNYYKRIRKIFFPNTFFLINKPYYLIIAFYNKNY